jgi:hypothetical protein
MVVVDILVWFVVVMLDLDCCFLRSYLINWYGATEVAKLRPEWSYWGIVSRPVSFHFFGFYLYMDVLCFTMNYFLFCRHDSEANAHAKFFGSSDKNF